MIVFPAIDLKRARCVRLTQGQADAETVYDDDPAAVALRWQEAGARWLHVVNLDGAFAGGLGAGGRAGRLPLNLRVLRDLVGAVRIPVQFGGGVRTIDDVALLLDLGAARVILGTAAVSNPALVSQAVARFGVERIVVGIDARDGVAATHGWQETSGVDAIGLGRQVRQLGVRRVVYTDIARDGMLTGVNVAATATLARETGLKVIASGGVAALNDLHALRKASADGIEGVVIGKALYTGAVDLAEAIRAARS